MNYIKILGASGSKAKGYNTSSFQVYKNIVIDAGNIVNSLGDEALHIEHIFLTHSHADHISDLPFVVESFYEKRKKPLYIYALKETIETLKKHSFNNRVWPDFSKINIPDTQIPSLIFKEIELNEEIIIGSYNIKAISANHIPGSCGFVVTKNKQSFLITGDTYINKDLIEELNKNHSIKALIIECSFPNKLNDLAELTKHLTPQLIHEQIKKINRNDLSIFYYHIKPIYEKEILNEIKKLNLLDYKGKILSEGDVIHIDSGTIEHNMITEDKFEEIMKISLDISSEQNKDKLLTNILTSLRKLTNTEAGTLYIKSKDEKYLDFKVVQNEELNIYLGEDGSLISWPSLELYLKEGNSNNTMVAVVCCNERRVINIKDVYKSKKYKFSGTKEFDKRTGYRSKSMLLVPLINHENEVIGVLQLINKKLGSKTIEFNEFDEKMLTSLASQSSISLTNTMLINSLEDFINAYITTIAKAIDAKSPYTADHIGRVEKIALMLAKEINEDKTTYKEITYTDNMYKQIALAAWMHDIGKISIPEHVLDKATKLEKIFDRIEVIDQRLNLLIKDKEISYLKNEILNEEFQIFKEKINSYIQFLKKINIGSEFMSNEDINFLNKIFEEDLITKDEFYNLSIKKGTLTKEEIDIIRNHAHLSLDMISELPFPKKYKDVLNIACNHHERLNGLGYPRGLSAEQISLEDRIMILADIFEALTAKDRPYKDAKKLSEVFSILSNLAKNGDIDKDLLKFFHDSEVLKTYAKEELYDYQIDNSELNF